MKQITLLILNTASLIFALVMNGLSNTGAFNGKTVGEASAELETLFAPAGYAFSIWGVIYILLIMFVGRQWVAWFKHTDDLELKNTGIWFALSNIANGTWIVAWLKGYIGVSVILMLILLISLIALTVKLRLEIWHAPKRVIFFVWWPICIYLGWIIVASVANIAAFLVSINWQGGNLSAEVWTIIIITAAAIIYLLLIYFRNLREAALVGIWALIAIAVKQWEVQPAIVTAAIAAAALLFIAISINAYKNNAAKQFSKQVINCM
jgi:hypothetical protein